jgi:phosphate transport system permease protein
MRALVDRLMTAVGAAVTLLGILPLLSIVAYTVARGASALTPSFFVATPAPVGAAGGGIGNALAGTALVVGLALILGVPAGVLAGLYLAEHAPSGPVAEAVRFVSDVLAGVPTIVVGVFVYTLLVVPLHTFSALSGGVALALILLPTVTRTTDAVLRLVPPDLRDAGLALGVPEWRVTLDITLRAALPGVLTGVLLGMARIAGETAPLLFTAFGNPYWSVSLLRPIAAVPLLIYEYAISPYPAWIAQAWGAALVLVTCVLAAHLLARLLLRPGRAQP